LGAFQGKPACVRIPLGKGVCGTAALTKETQIVPDVHAFPGHIACDADSRSELVIPILNKGLIVGVLDIDSPIPNRFDDATVSLVSKLARIWTDHQFSA
jgi:GAF domain-containing protein